MRSRSRTPPADPFAGGGPRSAGDGAARPRRLGVEASRRAQLARLSEIATVLWSSGFTWLVQAVGLQACVSLRCRVICSTRPWQQCPHHVAMDVPLPDRMRHVLERLGPTFVKAGQMLATRPDHVPMAYAEALRQLQSGAAPFDARAARRIVEEELGRPLEQSFQEFQAEPFAAASLSQVHRARLPDGRAVAVKVQRPGVGELIERDLGLLRWLARRLERRAASALAFRPSAAVEELADYTRRELDFRREARTSERLRGLLADEDGIVVPAVHWPLTTARVLTTDLVDGLHPAPAAELAAAGIDVDAVLDAGARAMVRQIFEFGIFHADPHPGNLLLLPARRVCLLDFGMYGRLERRERQRMGLVLWALVVGDYEAVGEQLLRLSAVQPGADVRGFRAAVADAVESWFEDRAGDTSVARLLLRELALGAAYGIVFPRDLMLLARALVNLEASARVIRPDIGLADLTRPLLPLLQHVLLPGPARLGERWKEERFRYLAFVLELPEMLLETAERRDSHVWAPAAASARPSRWLSAASLAVVLATSAGAGWQAGRALARSGRPAG